MLSAAGSERLLESLEGAKAALGKPGRPFSLTRLWHTPAVDSESPRQLLEAYSRACVRSGFGVLILVTFSAIAVLRAQEYQGYLAALEFAETGQRLRISLQEMQNHPCRPQSTDTTGLKLADFYLIACSDDRIETPSKSERDSIAPVWVRWRPIPPGHTPSAHFPQGHFPADVTLYNLPAAELITALKALRRETLIDAAQTLSASIRLDVRQWLHQWSSMQDSPLAVPREPPPEEFALSLTVADLAALAETFPLEVTEVEQLATRYQLRIPAIGIDAGLKQTGYILYALMFLLSFYFWANLRCAIRVPGFPAAGTMPYALLAGWLSRVLFQILIWSPAVVSFALLDQLFAGEWTAFLFFTAITGFCAEISASLAFRIRMS